MKKSKKLALLIMSFSPLFYMTGAFLYIYKISSSLLVFNNLYAFIFFAVIIIYIRIVIRSNINTKKKIIWIITFILLHYISLPIYWFKHIKNSWPTLKISLYPFNPPPAQKPQQNIKPPARKRRKTEFQQSSIHWNKDPLKEHRKGPAGPQ